MSEKTFCLYEHVFPNGKSYIGITSQKPENRWKCGKKYSYNALFFRAVNKYGWENIEHKILERELTERDAKTKEIELIKLKKTQDPRFGYNLTAGGDGMTGFKTYESTKRKLSEINKGKTHTEDSKRKMSESRRGEKAYWYGKKIPDHVRRKISEAKTGKNVGQDNYWYGKRMPAEVRAKMSANHYDASGSNNPRARQINMLDSRMSIIQTFDTITSAAEHRGCCFSTMQRYLSGKFRDRSGYIWRYANVR